MTKNQITKNQIKFIQRAVALGLNPDITKEEAIAILQKDWEKEEAAFTKKIAKLEARLKKGKSNELDGFSVGHFRR